MSLCVGKLSLCHHVLLVRPPASTILYWLFASGFFFSYLFKCKMNFIAMGLPGGWCTSQPSTKPHRYGKIFYGGEAHNHSQLALL